MTSEERKQFIDELYDYFVDRSNRLRKDTDTKSMVLFIDTEETLSMHPYRVKEE